MNEISPDVLVKSESDEAPDYEDLFAMKALRRALKGRRDLLTGGYAGRQIATLVADDTVSTRDIVDVAISDPAIIVRLIRMANTTGFSTRDRSEVVSIQRAINLIGQQRVRSNVLSLPAISEFARLDRRPIVSEALAVSSYCARFCRNFLDTRNPIISDEGAVTVILSRLWAVIGALHLPNEVSALRYVDSHAPHMSESIQREIFGLMPVSLNKEIIDSWGLPGSCNSQIILSERKPVPVIAGRDWMPLAIGMSLRIGAAVQNPTPAARDSAINDIVRRYRHCVDLKYQSLKDFMTECAYEAISVERSIGTADADCSIHQMLEPFLKEQDSPPSGWDAFARIDTTGVIARIKAVEAKRESFGSAADTVARLATGKPVDCSQRINMWADQFREIASDYASFEREGLLSEDLGSPRDRIRSRFIPLIINAIHDSFGYENVVWFERSDERAHFYKEAYAASADAQGVIEDSLPVDCSGLIHKAVEHRANVHINNAMKEDVRMHLPDWLDRHFPGVRSFYLITAHLPDESEYGFFLATRKCTDPDRMSDEDLAGVLGMRDQYCDLIREFGLS